MSSGGSSNNNERELGNTGYRYGPKQDGHGTYWYNPTTGDHGHETTRVSGSTISHYRHENGGSARGWTYNRETGETTRIG